MKIRHEAEFVDALTGAAVGIVVVSRTGAERQHGESSELRLDLTDAGSVAVLDAEEMLAFLVGCGVEQR